MKILCRFLNDLLFIYCFLVLLSTETDIQRAKKRAQQKQILIKKIANMMANGIKVCVQVNCSVFLSKREEENKEGDKIKE